MAGAEGLEPSRTVLETAMLPLHHAPISFASGIITQPCIKCKHFFESVQRGSFVSLVRTKQDPDIVSSFIQNAYDIRLILFVSIERKIIPANQIAIIRVKADNRRKRRADLRKLGQHTNATDDLFYRMLCCRCTAQFLLDIGLYLQKIVNRIR